MMLEDAPGSNNPVRVKEPHFPVFPEYRSASYAKRYELLMTRLVRSRLYDAACLLMSSREGGLNGEYREPNPELNFQNFLTSLLARAIAVARTQPPGPAATPQIKVGPEPDASTNEV